MRTHQGEKKLPSAPRRPCPPGRGSSAPHRQTCDTQHQRTLGSLVCRLRRGRSLGKDINHFALLTPTPVTAHLALPLSVERIWARKLDQNAHEDDRTIINFDTLDRCSEARPPDARNYLSVGHYRARRMSRAALRGRGSVQASPRRLHVCDVHSCCMYRDTGAIVNALATSQSWIEFCFFDFWVGAQLGCKRSASPHRPADAERRRKHRGLFQLLGLMVRGLTGGETQSFTDLTASDSQLCHKSRLRAGARTRQAGGAGAQRKEVKRRQKGISARSEHNQQHSPVASKML